MCSTCNHIFYIVCVTRTIYMGVMSFFSFIFNMRSRNSNSSFFFLWCFINLVISYKFSSACFSLNFCDSCSKCCFTMVDMTNSPNVTVGFVSYKFFFWHYVFTSVFFVSSNFNFLERVKGIEPLHPAWKASVLPLNYTRTTPRVTLHVI